MKHAKIHRINNMNKKLSDSFIKNNKTITITIIIITVFFYFTTLWSIDGLIGFKIIVLGCVMSVLLLGAKEILQKNSRIEKLFIICVIPIGLIYTLLIPPGIVPDEWAHMQNEFSLSSQLLGKEIDGKVTLRESELNFLSKQVINPAKGYYDFIYNNIISTDNSAYIHTEIDSFGITQLFAYFPAVLGITFARILHFGVVTTVYFGRLFNFIFYILLTYLSIKKIPFGKLLMFTITMLPMTCQQMFSLSYDTVVNSSAFICIAYGMFFVYQAKEIQFIDILIYGFSGLILLANKGSAYAFILVIPILAKYFNPGGDRIAKKTKIVIFLIVVICILILNYHSFTNNNQVTAIESVSSAGIVPWAGTPSYTLNAIIGDIPATFSLFLNTFLQKGMWYINTAIGSELGWLNILMPNWIINIWGIILIISTFSEKSNNDVFTHEHKILYFFIAVTIILIVMLAMALAWTPSGYSTIEGVQGRYFIPIIFLLLICFQNSKLYMNERITKVVLMIIVILPILTIGNLILLVL